jgi:uncharacterized protein YijF (DUF1287 family)
MVSRRGVLAVAGLVLLLAAAIVTARVLRSARFQSQGWIAVWLRGYDAGVGANNAAPTRAQAAELSALARAAVAVAAVKARYDPSYVAIAYPGGDVPRDTGVCTDLVVRSYRELGVDLQQDVHEDMSADFGDYPALWSLARPDANIDHRRVPNLMVFLRRHGTVLPITQAAADYLPGDIVAWDLGLGITHIGIIAPNTVPDSGRHLVAHHVSGRPTVNDVLFRWPIIGHFRYLPTAPP